MVHQQKRDSPCGYLSFVYVSSSALASDRPVVAAGYIIKQSRVDELAHKQVARRLLRERIAKRCRTRSVLLAQGSITGRIIARRGIHQNRNRSGFRFVFSMNCPRRLVGDLFFYPSWCFLQLVFLGQYHFFAFKTVTSRRPISFLKIDKVVSNAASHERSPT